MTLEAGAPTTIDPAGETRLEITLSNSNDASTITGVAFSNSLPGTLPDGLFVRSPATYECTDPASGLTTPGTGTLTAVPGTQALALSGGTIPARANNLDGTCSIVIPVTAGTSTGNFATYVYSIASGAVTGNDGTPVSNTGAVSQSVNVRAISAPRITQHFVSNGNTLILGGDAQTLTFRVQNDNAIPIANFSFTNTFPLLAGNPAFEIASAPNSTASCSSGPAPSFSPAPSSGDTSFTITGTLPANGFCTWSIDISALTTNNLFATTVVNFISRTLDWTNDIGIPLLANSSRIVTLQSPLLVDVDFTNAELATGQTDTMTVTWTNLANSGLLINSFVNDPIDGIGNAAFGLKLTGAPTMSCTAGTPGTFTVRPGSTGFELSGPMTLAPGAVCTITVTFVGTVQTSGTTITYTNAIGASNFTVGALGGASVVAQQASDSILVGDEIRVSIAAAPGSVGPGQPIRYRATIENFGAAAVNNLSITDLLPSGTSFLTGTIGGVNFTPTLSGAGCSGLVNGSALGATTANFTLGTLPGRVSANQTSSCIITYWVRAPLAGGSVSNNIPAGAVTWNGGASSNAVGSNTVTTGSRNVLDVVNTFSPSSAFEGQISRLTITFSNWSVFSLANLSYAFTLPVSGGTGGQLQIAPIPNAATTCTGASLTAVAGSTSLSMSGGTVPPRASGGIGANGSCFVQVDVIGPAGTYNNSLTATADSTNADGSGPVSVSATSNVATLTYASALSANTFFNPGSVQIGGQAVAIIRLANGGAGELTGVALTDVLPAGLTVAPSPAPYTTCNGATSITVSPDSTTIDLAGARIPAGQTCDLVFEVIASSGGPWTNTIPSGGITATGGVINVNPVSATLGVLASQDLFIAKSTNPSSLSFPGQTSRLRIEITNGTLPVTQLSLTDHFTVDGTSGGTPNGMLVTGTPQATTTCSGGTVSASPGGASVTLSGAALGPNVVCEIEVNVTSIVVGGITNIIPVGAISTAQGYSNANQALTSLTTQANVGVIKSFSPSVIGPGERSRLTITIFNPTSTPVANLAVNDALPAGMTIPGGASPSTTCAGGTVGAPTNGPVTLTGGTLAAASGGSPGSCQVSVDVTAAATGTLTNVIQPGDVTGSAGGQSVTNPDPATADLVVTLPVEVQVAIDNLTLDTAIQTGAPFTTGSASSSAGTSEVLTIRLRNPGSTPLTALGLTDALPPGLVLSTTPNGTTTCAGGTVTAPVSGTSIALSGATLPGGAACTITANVLSNTPGIYVDDIPAGAVSTFEGVTNGQATSARLILLDPPTVGLAFDLPVIPPSGTSTAIISLGNTNSTGLTLTGPFVFDLPVAPGAILVDGTPNITTTCGGAVTATAGSASITLASGGTIPAGGCEIRVDVTGTVPGNYTGVIAAGDLVTNAGPNPAPATAPLAISTQGYISGKVFADNDVTPDGAYTPGTDTPLSGVAIELHGSGTCGGAPIETATTDAQGNYVFFPLAAGTYSVCQPAQPANSFNGIPTAGSIVTVGGSTGTPGTASNPTATSSEIVGIVLGSNAGNTSGSPDNTFAEVLESEIAGTVFLDANNDGLLNGTEAGIAGETIELLVGGSVVATEVTDGNGDYAFTGLAPDTYTIRQPNQPANSANGQTIPGPVPNGGTPGAGTATNAVPSQIVGLVLPPNTLSPDNDFAEIPNSRTVSGLVFVDFNDDGVLNGSDYGIPGQTIDLTGTDINTNTVTASVTTDGTGAFSFTGLPEGTYTLTQPAQPADTTDGRTTAGSTGGTATAQGTTPSVISGIDLTGLNTVSGDNLFPEIPAPAPDLSVAISHSPASFAEGNDDGIFTVDPSNVGATDSSGTITIVTTLPAGITPTGATGSGWSCSIAALVVTCTTSNVIPAGGTGNPITITTQVGPGLAGQVLTASTAISGGSEPATFNGNNTDTDPVPISAGATVSGSIWRDLDHDRIRDPGEPPVAGWIVELVLGGTVVATETTDASGAYDFVDQQPGTGYSIVFREPTTGAIFGPAVTNETGAPFTNGVSDPLGNPGAADVSDGTHDDIILLPGGNVPGQSLPLDPAGVVYDSISRLPVAGATVTINGPPGFTAADVVGGSASTTTGADGFYQFLLLPGAPAGTYTLSITNPSSYVPGLSTQIPECAATLAVGAVPDPALVQNQNTAPATSATLHDPATCPATSAGLAAGGTSTQYYTSFTLTPGVSADVLNNHIPLDPILAESFVVTKTTPSEEVYRGALVPYTITARNALAVTLSDVTLTDIIPPGFSYRAGSATLDGASSEPVISGRTLRWTGQSFAPGEVKELRLVLTVGAGVGDGEYTNEAFAVNALAGTVISNIATATVRIAPDPVFDCADIIGKVFNDRNGNGVQDEGEEGLSNVTVSTVNGLLITTDDFGRYHVPCAAIPDAFNGSNFIMKLDESTLPFGYMMTSENPEVVRVTRGKLSKINFGAAIYRLARIELFDSAFDGTEPTPELLNSIRLLPETLSEAPTIVRLIHRGDRGLAQPRLDRLERLLKSAWAKDGCCYPLTVEQEILAAPLSAKNSK